MFNLYFSFIQKIKRSIFPFFKDRELKTIFAKLQEGYPKEQPVARFVGGSVRKYLSGEKIDDIDVATILTIKQINFDHMNISTHLWHAHFRSLF